MTRRNLIILGGSEDQVPAYLEGRRLGYRVIGIDQKPDALGAELADEFLCLTTREPEAIAKRLGDIDVAAVISPASDAAQASVAALSKHYGTAFQPSPAAVRASEDKNYFHSVVEKLSFPRYRSLKGDDPDALIAAAAGMTYPLVVKPTDSSGSKGLSCVPEPAQLRAAIGTARKNSFASEVLIEELVDGRHYSLECFAQNGRPAFTVVTERIITPLPHMISVSHVTPAALGCSIQGRLLDMITAIFGELGHRSGPVNFDFVLTPAGDVHFIEMGARLGGNGMPLLASHAFGVNTVEAAIRLAAGEALDLGTHPRPRFVMLRILTAETDGTLVSVAGVSTVRALTEVTELRLFKAPGSRVNRYTQAAHKLGYLILAADSREALSQALDTSLATLHFEIEPDDETQEN
ncbi:ATP-grasp domain-containing protein [Actinoplanes awajinensis]|uniref:Biotin carboxylase n=1 Tax=Actinoplanes awajinensis subsp. mycoplanecinus TaxID=135947 RepID=A0A0X3UUH2_9ACTN|nr:ATP-grasp domain-containing protein [Actinoplanes awajinensis]KUL34516.1 biotin carboxylase [Actinoplanes awajinensis subsp. mycoplanecinus]